MNKTVMGFLGFVKIMVLSVFIWDFLKFFYPEEIFPFISDFVFMVL